MAYDRKAIDAAEKSGLLGSAMDASALSLDPGERADLLRKLNADRAGGDEAEGEQEEEGRGENIYERLRRRDAEKQPAADGNAFVKMLNDFLQKIVEYFRSLFGGSGKDAVKRKELKELEKALLAFHLPVYDPKLGLVRKTFMDYLSQIHKKVEEFAAFFTRNSTVGADDFIHEKSPSFPRFVIETQLSAEQAHMLSELRKMDMAGSLTVRGEAVAQRDIGISISKFIESFAGNARRRIDECLDFYNALLNLNEYNFTAVFSLFRSGDILSDTNEFKDFSLAHCVAQLRNLDSYLAKLNFERLREDHYNWFDRFRELTESEAVPRYSSEDFRSLIGLLRKLRAKDVVGNLVRIGSEDPSYRAAPLGENTSWVAKYCQLAESSFKDKLERSVLLFREEQMQIQVNEIFEGLHPFAWHPVLNRTVNVGIEHAGGAPLANLFLYNLLWNYAHSVYVEHYKQSVSKIIAEGQFRKRERATEFANTYHDIDACYERMLAMNSRTDKESPFASRLDAYISGNLVNAVAVKTFTNELSLLDAELYDLSQQCGLSFMKLNRFMEGVVSDFKSLNAGDLINAKTIGGISNRNLLYMYDKLAHSLKKLEAVLSRFIVVSDQLPDREEKKP